MSHLSQEPEKSSTVMAGSSPSLDIRRCKSSVQCTVDFLAVFAGGPDVQKFLLVMGKTDLTAAAQLETNTPRKAQSRQ